MSKCLISVVHDPDGKLVKPFHDDFMKVTELFDYTILEATPNTVSPAHHDGGIVLTYHEMNGLGNARRRVLQKGVETDCDVIFFCDFDRLLYWWLMYPNELKVHIANLPDWKFTVFGRTKAAMDTHPQLQRETEQICNELFNRRFDSNMDILAACRSIPLEAAKLILDKSTATNPACVDAEWPSIIGGLVDYTQVNGLGYESALFGIERPWEEEMLLRIRNLSELAAWLINIDLLK